MRIKQRNNSSDESESLLLLIKVRFEAILNKKGILPTFELIDYKDINLALEKEVVLSENFFKRIS